MIAEQASNPIPLPAISAPRPPLRAKLAPFLPPALCCSLVLACILISNPFAGAAFNDALSYSHLALKFAQTGKMLYDGYGSPTALTQTVWAAPWIRLFGFSFDILRIATIPFSLGIVCLVYALGRQAGLSRLRASFASLIIGTSPLFLPMAASFMTDIFGCFFFLLCVYSAVRAAEAAGQDLAVRWLWVAAIAGVLGAADRQIIWSVPLALLPFLGWKWRSRKPLLIHAALAFFFCCAALLFVVRAFSPPYAPLAMNAGQLLRFAADHTRAGAGQMTGLLIACLTTALPALLSVLANWRKIEGAVLFLVLLGSFAAMVLLCLAFGQSLLVPAIPGILSANGVLVRGSDSLGFRPAVIPVQIRFAITCSVIFCAVVFLILRRKACSPLPRETRAVFFVCSLAYTALLLPGAIMSLTFDRYVMPMAALLAIVLLANIELESTKIPPAGWIALVALAFFGIGVTHDYASAQRARIQAAGILQQRGISRSHISCGLEYDAWTQLEQSGKINVQFDAPFEFNSTNRFWLWQFLPGLEPDYVVLNQKMDSTSNADLVTVPFTNWFPPFLRKAVARKREDLPPGKLCRNNDLCTEELDY